MLETFAREAEAGVARIILLVLDNAGWHGAANLKIPNGIRLLYLPPYTPELQPAETLWTLVNEPIVNQHIATIAEARRENRRPVHRPRRAARANPEPNRVPLVAKAHRSELINRKWYHQGPFGDLAKNPSELASRKPLIYAGFDRPL